jgi:hypothetical protein
MNANADAMSRIAEINNKKTKNETSKEDLMEALLSIVTLRNEKNPKDKLIYHAENILESKERNIVVCTNQDAASAISKGVCEYRLWLCVYFQ